jgi:micrococcal nuclease
VRKTWWLCVVITVLIVCARTDKVVEVIDGDTFKTDAGETVRLLGINAPETGDPGADIAKHALVLLVQEKRVRLEPDITEKDDYDRLLMYVFVDDILINAEMVRMGYAETRFYPPDTLYKAELESIEKIAIRNKRGLWSFDVFQVPDTAAGAKTVLPDDPVRLDVISWRDADQYYGMTKIVEGRIVVTNNTGKVCFLNFDKNWKKYFTAVIFSSDYDKFPSYPEEYYLNRLVRVKGLIKEYKGKPEIILKSQSQIEVIE